MELAGIEYRALTCEFVVGGVGECRHKTKTLRTLCVLKRIPGGITHHHLRPNPRLGPGGGGQSSYLSGRSTIGLTLSGVTRPML